MLDPKRLCAGRITVVSISGQKDVIINPGLKSALDTVSRDGWKNRTSGCSAAIYSNQYRNLFIRQASLAGLAAPAACLSVKIAIPFTAFQNIGFVSLDNAFELRVGAAPVRPRNDAANKTLWKPLNYNDLQTPGSLAHRQGILHR